LEQNTFQSLNKALYSEKKIKLKALSITPTNISKKTPYSKITLEKVALAVNLGSYFAVPNLYIYPKLREAFHKIIESSKPKLLMVVNGGLTSLILCELAFLFKVEIQV
jgi:hypothetical protein